MACRRSASAPRAGAITTGTGSTRLIRSAVLDLPDFFPDDFFFFLPPFFLGAIVVDSTTWTMTYCTGRHAHVLA